VETAGNKQILWNDIDGKKITVTQSADDVEKLAQEWMLCINGDVLENIITKFETPSKTV